jgi:pimeloyl-ACP methyl ester carboxylesterase
MNGVFAPDYRMGLNGPREAQQSLDEVIARCAAADACRSAFPKLAGDVASVLASIEKTPATATVPIGDGQTLKVTLTKTIFARELRQLLMSRDGIQAVPLLFHAAAGGDFLPFAAAALETATGRSGQADGMALSVLCADDAAAPYPAAALAQATRGTFLRDERAQYLKRACAIWPHAPRAPGASAPVRAATPALLVSGSLDPATPPAYATAVARDLPNSAHIVFTTAAHVPANPCVHGILTAFFKSGSASGLDTACVAAFPAFRFVTSMPKLQ